MGRLIIIDVKLVFLLRDNSAAAALVVHPILDVLGRVRHLQRIYQLLLLQADHVRHDFVDE